MSGNKSLRRELDAASTIIFPSAYLAKLDELKKRFQHSIRVLPEAAGKIARFNCFAYAFGVWDKPRYERLVDQTNNSALMNSGFIMERLDRGELIEIDAAEAQSWFISPETDSGTRGASSQSQASLLSVPSGAATKSTSTSFGRCHWSTGIRYVSSARPIRKPCLIG
jgi:hypothetical protein